MFAFYRLVFFAILSTYIAEGHKNDGIKNFISSHGKIFSESNTDDLVNKILKTAGGSSNSSDGKAESVADEDDHQYPLIIRFHFIRHGETEANVEQLVLGQIESDLTLKGRQQAIMTGRAFYEKQQRAEESKFWDICYASDLKRTQDTARLIIQNAYPPVSTTFLQKDDIISFITSSDPHRKKLPPIIKLTKLLRERAKGVREGRPKQLSDDEMHKLHKLEEEIQGKTIPLPLYETELDVYERLAEFIGMVVQTVVSEEQHHEEDSVEEEVGRKTATKVINVVVVSHSATIRVLTNYIIDPKFHWIGSPSMKSPPYEVDKSRIVPNLSITSIDVIPRNERGEASASSLSKSWSAVNAELPNVDHLQKDQVTAGDDEAIDKSRPLSLKEEKTTTAI